MHERGWGGGGGLAKHSSMSELCYELGLSY